MNTKSFVNGLDPENTVKGYYDENDQLVLVEPEGSGGGGEGDGDYTLASMTVEGTTSDYSVYFTNGVSVLTTYGDQDENKAIASLNDLSNGVYRVVLYKGHQLANISPELYTVTGDYDAQTGLITGDFTISPIIGD